MYVLRTDLLQLYDFLLISNSSLPPQNEVDWLITFILRDPVLNDAHALTHTDAHEHHNKARSAEQTEFNKRYFAAFTLSFQHLPDA